MATAVLTGGDGLLGRRVADVLESECGLDVVRVAGLHHPAESETDRRATRRSRVDLDLREIGELDRADVVVDLGASDHDRRAERRESATQFAASTLGLADRLGARHVVLVSSALVYGAAPNNPRPLTEEAVLRPDVDFVFARQLGSAEELVEQWRLARPGRITSILRPAVGLARGGSSRLAAALVAGLGRRLAMADPPSQFLHLDDLATAVGLTVRERADGVFNVAPDGWVPGDRVRALSGERPRLPLPERVGEVLSGLSWRFQRGPIPPGLISYTREPWVISNGRLRALGWEPMITNEQAYVEATEAPWWTTVSPKRRQEMALGIGLFVGVVAAAATGWAVLRWWRRSAANR
ncbi:MAG: NAD-dependent epimerase/dehydratase family protein [Actinomycetota bacterium]